MMKSDRTSKNSYQSSIFYLRNLMGWIVIVFVASCQPKETTQKNVITISTDAETEQMVVQLKQLLQSVDVEQDVYQNNKRADYYAAQFASAPNENKFNLKMIQGAELLNAGKTEEGINAFNMIFDLLDQNNVELPLNDWLYLKAFQAIGYMRQGEQENCIANHNPASCIFPIEGNGVHQLKKGSQSAILAYTEMLEKDPNNLNYIWLLNLAHMTLGSYPDAVPAKYLIPEHAFRSNYPLPPYPDISAKLGVDANQQCGGSIVEDFNNDGLLDIMVSSWNLEHDLKLYINHGNDGFQEVGSQVGLAGLSGGLNLLCADYDNDGDFDVFVLRGAWRNFATYPNSLLQNNGDGTFRDVTQSAGIYSMKPTQTASWADFNNDGWLDLFIGNESFSGRSHPCELFINNTQGGFTNVAIEANLNLVEFVKGVATGDYNNDGWPDIYLSIMDSPNKLFKNLGIPNSSVPQFKEVALQAGVQNPIQSFPTWFFDYNNDGWEDLFVASYSMSQYNNFASETAAEFLNKPWKGEAPCLFQNNKDGTFSNVSISLGLNKPIYTMGCNYGDLDNDGWLDFYLGTGEPDFQAIVPNRMFRNNNGLSFQDVTSAGGFGHIQKGHGVSFADINNDGDQDIYAVMGGAYEGDFFRNTLFENPGNQNDWITLLLRGTQSNQGAIGTRIAIELETENGSRTIHRTVSTGGSFGVSPHRSEIGLGANASITKLSIFWPTSGIEQVFENVSSNKHYTISEDVQSIEELSVTVLDYSRLKPKEHQHH